MSHQSDSGNLPRKPTRKVFRMSGAAALRNLGQGDFTPVVARALRVVTSGMAAAAKVLAEAANANVRTAENWMAARTIPNVYHWECLKEAFPALEVEIKRLRGLEAEGETIERQINTLITYAVRLKASHDNLARENRGADAALSRGESAEARREGGALAAAPRPADAKT